MTTSTITSSERRLGPSLTTALIVLMALLVTSLWAPLGLVVAIAGLLVARRAGYGTPQLLVLAVMVGVSGLSVLTMRI